MFSLAALDPRTKMVMIAAISTAAMAVENLRFLLGLLLFTSALLAAGKVGFRQQLKQARMAVGMVVFLFLLQALFGQMELGAVLSVRLLIVIVSALILLTGAPRDYLLGLVQWKIPYEIAYMVIIGLHFFPILREEAMDVYYSIQLRGMEIKKASIAAKLRVYLKISLPILAGAMERAKDMSISMEARAFRAYPKRTYMRKLKLKARDLICMTMFPLLAAVFILTGCMAGTGTEDHMTTETSRQEDRTVASQILLSQTENPQSSQAVSWYSCRKETGLVHYGIKNTNCEARAERTKIREGEYYRYKAVLTGLRADTTYQYCVGNGQRWSKVRSFTTAGKGNFSFLFMGDIQYQVRERDYETWGTLLRRACREHPDINFGILSGDMVEKSADIQDWSAFFNQSQSVFSRIPLAAVPGNHETSIIPYTYLQMLPQPENSPLPGEVYSFDYGDCHFLMLNSCLFMEERIRDMGKKRWQEMIEQLRQWIRTDLSHSSAKWKIAVMHHPPYPITEDDPIYSRIRKNWIPVLSEGGVACILCGHQHVYMRTKEQNGITCIMGNSGQKQSYYDKKGEPLSEYIEKMEARTGTYQVISVSENNLKVEAFDENGVRFDVWELPKL